MNRRRHEPQQTIVLGSLRVKFEDGIADHYHERVSKYERASIYPWETIAPDGTEPGPPPEGPSLVP